MKVTKKVLFMLVAAALIFSLSGVATATNCTHVDGTPAVISYCAIVDENNVLWMWGPNYSHIMDVAGGSDSEDEYGRPYQPTPKKIMENVKSVSTDGGTIAVIKTDNSLWMWGRAEAGIIGNNYQVDLVDEDGLEFVLTPVKVMDDVAEVSVGAMHTIALKNDGSLWGWGDNDHGQLGNGKQANTTWHSYPCQTVPVKIMDDVRTICTYTGLGDMGGSAGGTAVIKEDNSLWMWGSNASGQLGSLDIYDELDYAYTPAQPYQTIPVKVMDDVATMAGGHRHFAVVKTDGTLWTWGCDSSGALGNGNDGYFERRKVYSPAMVLDGVVDVFCTAHSTGAIRADGSLWTWGSNIHGRLGIDSDSESANNGFFVPQKVMDNVADASGMIAVKMDGTVWSWGTDCGVEGANNANQGITKFRSTPVQIPDLVCEVSGESKNVNAPFADVNSTDWYYEAVSFVYDQKLMIGTGERRFAPDMQLTRGMLVKILHTMEGMPSAGEVLFSDVSAGDWYAPGVAWATKTGVAYGYGNGKFGPKDTLTVEQAVALLHRYAEYKGTDVSPESQNLGGLKDANKASDWALEALRWASGVGLFDGMNRSLSPDEGATRAQIAVLIYNFTHLA